MKIPDAFNGIQYTPEANQFEGSNFIADSIPLALITIGRRFNLHDQMFGSEEVNIGSPVASATATGGVMLFCENSLARTAYTWPNIPPRKLHGKY